MFLTKKHLSRRTVLKAAGVQLALPLLDAMVPAFAAPADKKTPVRLVFGYVPNGMMMADWTPKGTGKDFKPVVMQIEHATGRRWHLGAQVTINLDGDAGCDPKSTIAGTSQGLAALANISAHELSEALTDPELNAWYDTAGNENSDACRRSPASA